MNKENNVFIYDGKMNYERAKRELELGNSFTDDELKKAYRKLTRRYHPDINGITDEEKNSFSEHMKAINAAYKYLKEYTKGSSQTKSSKNPDYYFSLEKYKEEKIKQFISSINCVNLNVEIKYFENKICAFLLYFGLLIKDAGDKEEVDILINKSYKEFDDLLLSQVNYFCSQNGIRKQDLDIYFNLGLEISKRNPEQLCAKLNNTLNKIKKTKIEEIVQEYIGYAGYIDIKDKIDNLKYQALNSNDKINEILKKLKENMM